MTPQRWRQIQDVLAAVLPLAPEARAAFLDEACRSDPGLRDEVAALLQAHDGLGPIDALAEAFAGPLGGPRPRAAPLEGHTVAQYQVQEKLGGGGMGVVYRALDTTLQRPVALKFLPPHLAASPEAKQRFLHEAQAASALDHPNICTIHEIGQTGDDQLFIAMAFYEGETLKKKIGRGPLPVEEAVHLARQIAEALAAAHAAGIVHRDVKPANVMVTAGGRVKLLDFGLAKLEDVTLTRAGTRLGTVSYMSPEQARGDTVDARTDIWALGVVFYEMLAGRRPFRGEGEQAVLYSIREAAPEPVLALRPEVGEALSEVVDRALAKDPAARYQTMDALLGALGGERSEAGRARRSGRRWRRYTALAGGIAVLLGALWIGAGLLRSSEGAALDSVAVLPLENLSGDPGRDYIADGMTEELIHTLGQVGGLRVAARTSSFAFQGRPVDVREVGRRLGVATVLEGSLLGSEEDLRIVVRLVGAADGLQIWSGTYDRKLEEVLAIQNDIARAVASALEGRLGGEALAAAAWAALDPVAYEHYLKGRYFWNKRTAAGLHRAVDHFRQAIDRAPTYARAYAGLADAYCILGFYDWQPPREAFPKARAAAQRALEIDPSMAEPHAALGYVALYYDWDWEESERQFRRAIERNPRYAVAHQWYANYLTAMGRFEEAAREMQWGLALDPLSLINAAALGWTYTYAGRYDEAVEEFRRTLEMDRSFVLAYLWLGQTYELQGRTDLAVDTLRHAVGLSGRDPIVVAALARAYAVAGDRRRAEALLEEVEGGGAAGYVPSYEIAAVYAALGHAGAAVAWLDRAYAERSHSLAFLKIDPRWRPLHPHPGFRRRLAAVGLTP
ncbi:MAG: protein kinase [Rhodothermales bacterium]|nr:protein kinase [Rhodothermales bacterium]